MTTNNRKVTPSKAHDEWLSKVRRKITEDITPALKEIPEENRTKINRTICDLSLFAANRFNLENFESGIAPILESELPQCRMLKHSS